MFNVNSAQRIRVTMNMNSNLVKLNVGEIHNKCIYLYIYITMDLNYGECDFRITIMFLIVFIDVGISRGDAILLSIP